MLMLCYLVHRSYCGVTLYKTPFTLMSFALILMQSNIKILIIPFFFSLVLPYNVFAYTLISSLSCFLGLTFMHAQLDFSQLLLNLCVC